MNRVHRLPLLVLIIILAATALVTGTLALRPVSASPANAATPYAVALAVSPATHHVFALSGDGGASWVSMLDATSHQVLNTVSVPAGGQRIFVDDAAKHVLVISCAVPAIAPTMTRVTMLDAKTGKLITTRSLTKGVVRWVEEKSGLKRLFIIVGPSSSTRWFGAGAMLYALNTQSLKVVHTITLRAKDQVARAIPSSGRLLIGNADGSVRFYDVFRTWKVAARVRRPLPNPSVIGSDDRFEALGVINGPQRDTLTILSSLTGAVMYETTYPPLTEITGYALYDPFFRVMTAAGPLKDGVPTGNGRVSVQNPSSGEELAETSVGVSPVQALIDPKTKHAFVLSYDRIDEPGGWKSRLLVSTFDLTTGKLLEQTPVVAASGSTMPDFVLDAATGHLYLTGLGLTPETQASANQLIALSPKTGKIMHNVRLPDAPTT